VNGVKVIGIAFSPDGSYKSVGDTEPLTKSIKACHLFTGNSWELFHRIATLAGSCIALEASNPPEDKRDKIAFIKDKATEMGFDKNLLHANCKKAYLPFIFPEDQYSAPHLELLLQAIKDTQDSGPRPMSNQLYMDIIAKLNRPTSPPPGSPSSSFTSLLTSHIVPSKLAAKEKFPTVHSFQPAKKPADCDEILRALDSCNSKFGESFGRDDLSKWAGLVNQKISIKVDEGRPFWDGLLLDTSSFEFGKMGTNSTIDVICTLINSRSKKHNVSAICMPTSFADNISSINPTLAHYSSFLPNGFLDQTDILLVPRLFRVHFTLYVIDFIKETVFFLDSLRGKVDKYFLKGLERYCLDREVDVSKFNIETRADIPIQSNSVDCCYHVCMNMEILSRGNQLTSDSYKQEEIEYLKLRMLHEIFNCRFLKNVVKSSLRTLQWDWKLDAEEEAMTAEKMRSRSRKGTKVIVIDVDSVRAKRQRFQ